MCRRPLLHSSTPPSLPPSLLPSLLLQPVALPLCPCPPRDFPQGLAQLLRADGRRSLYLRLFTPPPAPPSSPLPPSGSAGCTNDGTADGTGSRAETKRDGLSRRAGGRRGRRGVRAHHCLSHSFSSFFYYHNVGAFITVSDEKSGEREIL